MPKRKHRFTWDEVAVLDAAALAKFGAFEGWAGPVEFDDVEPSRIMLVHDPDEDQIQVAYDWQTAAYSRHICSTVPLERVACRLGGTRAYFRCPRCADRVLRLAVLDRGLLCGRCGSVTWASRRETEVQRLVRRANVLAGKLNLEHFLDDPVRPNRMRADTYIAILEKLGPLKTEIDRRARARVARSSQPLLALAALARWGL